MIEIIFLLYAVCIGFLNTAAGRDFFGLTNSTTINRTLFATGSAGLTTLIAASDIGLFIGLFIGLYAWRTPGWGDFFAAIHGRRPHWRATGDAQWAVWLSDRIWPIEPKDGMETRLKATLDMSIRMSLIVPAVTFVAIYTGNYWGIVTALAFPLMGIAYFIGGIPKEHKYSIAVAEFITGLVMAVMLWEAI